MPALLLLVLLLVPIAEIYVFAQVAHLIGVPLALVVLLTLSALGAVLVKREGLRTWRGLRETLRAGRVPARELADAALVLVGGALLLTPGFLTDVVGFLLVLPPTRAAVRRLLTTLAMRRALGPRRSGGRGGGSGRAGSGPVIEGSVVEGSVGERTGGTGSGATGQVPDVRRPRSR